MTENARLVFPQSAVIGAPIAHSKSPIIHRYWLKKYNLVGDYIRLDVGSEKFEATVRCLCDIGFRGANVTLPHKEAALAIADQVSARARKIGAANTLFFDGHEIIADNTDAEGFYRNLQHGAPSWRPQGKTALVLGAGGAARAIVFALLDAGVSRVIVANRTQERAHILVSELGGEVLDWEARADAVSHADLIVNTTSLGMAGHKPLDLDLSVIRSTTIVTDIVYAPLKTPLLADAEARGCVVVDGLGMLLHQAVPGFARWFGIEPEVDEDLRAEVLK